MKSFRSLQLNLWSARLLRLVVALCATLVAACGGGGGGGGYGGGMGGMSSSAPMITQQPMNVSVMQPATATFTVVASNPSGYGGTPLTYVWYRGTSVIPNATMASYTTGATSVMADNGATFYVNVTNSYGTTRSNTVTLTVM